MVIHRIRPLAVAVLLALAHNVNAKELRMSCASVSGNGACEMSAGFVQDVQISDDVSARFSPVTRFAPSVSDVALVDGNFGKALFFKEAYVTYVIGSMDMYAGVRKLAESVKFDFAIFQPGARADGREPFASPKSENATGTSQIAFRTGDGGIWNAEIAVIGSAVSTLPGKDSPWAFPISSGLRLSDPDTASSGIVGFAAIKIDDARIAVMAGHTSSNSVTGIRQIGATFVQPQFALQNIFALAAEKPYGDVTIRAGLAHHNQNDGDSFSRGVLEVQRVLEYADGSSLYASGGYAHVWQSEGSAFDLNRVFTNHVLAKVEYMFAGGVTIGGMVAYGVRDGSGYAEAEVRIPVKRLATMARARSAEISVSTFAVSGGDGTGPTTVFSSYGDRHGAKVGLLFKF